MQKEIAKLKNSSEENLKLVVLLTQKTARKKAKIAAFKRQIENTTSKLSIHTAKLSELKKEVLEFKDKSIDIMRLLREQMKTFTERLKSWEDMKLLFANPKEMQALIKQKEFFKGIIFPVEKEYLADNICKLQRILKEKTELLLSLENGNPNEKNVFEELECPYKKNVGLLETQTEELKGRIDILEKKEKLLNKMCTSNVPYYMNYIDYMP